MRIEDIRAYEGPNIHGHFPVTTVSLNLGIHDGRKTSEYCGFVPRLMAVLPGLRDHFCSLGRAGGFQERLREGTYLGHVVEHVALELQKLAGLDVIYGKTRKGEQPGMYTVIFESRGARAGAMAGRMALELVLALLEGRALELDGNLRVLRAVVAQDELGPTTAAIAAAARRRGIPFLRLDGQSLLQLGQGARGRRLRASLTDRTSCLAVDLAKDKFLSKRFLQEAGIPVPRGLVAADERAALTIAGELRQPVVMKPLDGNQGKGVTLDLRGEKEFRVAYRLAAAYSRLVLVEKFIPGRHYRLLVVGDRLVAAAERFPARVRGDGRHTISELIELANQDPRRGEAHEKPLTRIRVDAVVLLCLARSGLTLDSVLEPGRWVNLRDNANLSTGGSAADVTDEVHPLNAQLAVDVARIVGLDVAGVDLVAMDISRPVTPGQGAVIEVNASPGLRMHLYPSAGRPRDVAGAIVEWLFPPGAPSRIPVVAVTGTNGKTTICRLVAHLLRETGLRVGLSCTDGIFLDRHQLLKADASGPRSARTLLTDSRVEAAVLETARGGILRHGLGYDESDVGVVTNISPDHEGQDGAGSLEDIAYAKALVVERVRRDGHSVLNADDPFVLDMARRARGEVILVSSQEENLVLRKHVAGGGKAAGLKGGRLVLWHGSRDVDLLAATQLPFAHHGKSLPNLANALMAAAAAWALGVGPEAIARGLRGFGPGLPDNPGRFNLHNMGAVRVMVDYGHNRAAWQAAIDLARALNPRRLWGVVGAPGDRLDQNYVELGRVAGGGFDRIIIKEDLDLRGRSTGEVAGLILRGVLEAGVPDQNVEIILDEADALARAIRGAGAGDLVVVFFERHDRVLQTLEQVGGSAVAWEEGTVALPGG
ncbi:MAG: cyanophycin synthetase [bacterium]|nr:cyanophycin synthetase [bacterium]